MDDARPDHVILHTHDIDAAVDAFTEQGFVVQMRDDAGHSHGTESRFVVFESGAYLLLMQFTDPAKRKTHRLGALLETSAVLVDYGVAVADSGAAEEAARSVGLVPSAAGEHRNVLANGTPWGVRLFTLGRGAVQGHDALPFIVADLEPRAGRVPAYVPHPNGIAGLAAIHVEASEAARAASLLGSVVNARPKSDGALHRVPLDRASVIFHERDETAPHTLGGGGILKIDVTAASPAPEMICHGARITILTHASEGLEDNS